jgi:hypothetical protein
MLRHSTDIRARPIKFQGPPHKIWNYGVLSSQVEWPLAFVGVARGCIILATPERSGSRESGTDPTNDRVGSSTEPYVFSWILHFLFFRDILFDLGLRLLRYKKP